MTLPSAVGGATTEQVGYFEIEASDLAEWITRGLDTGWQTHPAKLVSAEDVLALLPWSAEVSRYLCVSVGKWTALLSNGPNGTDVGVLPSYAARELRCRAIRVVSVDDTAIYPARVLEVYGPDGTPPLALERSIVAANDGGRWVFETTGLAYPFENESAYVRRAKARRFTTGMVYEYLRALGVPIDVEPEWRSALLIEGTSQSG